MITAKDVVDSNRPLNPDSVFAHTESKPPTFEVFTETPEDMTRILNAIMSSTQDLCDSISDSINDRSCSPDMYLNISNGLGLLDYIHKFRYIISQSIEIS